MFKLIAAISIGAYTGYSMAQKYNMANWQQNVTNKFSDIIDLFFRDIDEHEQKRFQNGNVN